MESTIANLIDTKPQYKKDRVLYILQAAIEYFITIMVGTTYIAKVGIEIGMNDSSVALLSSVLQFSYTFQLLAMFFNKFKHPKKWITPFLLIIEVCFTLVYIIPIMPLPQGVRPLILVAAVVAGWGLHNINSVAKSTWMIGFVPDDRRGKFTALCQTVSLISGTVFTYVIGSIIDYYEALGDMHSAFIVMGIIIACISIIHVILFLCTKEIPNEDFVNVSLIDQVKSIVKNKNLMKIMPIYALYYMAYMCVIPFYHTYSIKELGFSMSYLAIMTAISSLSRSVASIFLGKYGDKHGFVRMLNIAFIFVGSACVLKIFTVPENGQILYPIATVLVAISNAGIGVADANIIFEYAPLDVRVGALAIKGTLVGIVSFLVTLAATPIVNYIQANGNQIFGINMYAQQFMSIISVIGMVIVLIYVNTVAKTAQKYREQ